MDKFHKYLECRLLHGNNFSLVNRELNSRLSFGSLMTIQVILAKSSLHTINMCIPAHTRLVHGISFSNCHCLFLRKIYTYQKLLWQKMYLLMFRVIVLAMGRTLTVNNSGSNYLLRCIVKKIPIIMIISVHSNTYSYLPKLPIKYEHAQHGNTVSCICTMTVPTHLSVPYECICIYFTVNLLLVCFKICFMLFVGQCLVFMYSFSEFHFSAMVRNLRLFFLISIEYCFIKQFSINSKLSKASIDCGFVYFFLCPLSSYCCLLVLQ